MGPPAARFRNHPATKVDLAGNRIYSHCFGVGRRLTQTLDWVLGTETESSWRRTNKRHVGFDHSGDDLVREPACHVGPG